MQALPRLVHAQQHNCSDGEGVALVGPRVPSTVLNEGISCLQLEVWAFVQKKCELSRENHNEVDGRRGMHPVDVRRSAMRLRRNRENAEPTRTRSGDPLGGIGAGPGHRSIICRVEGPEAHHIAATQEGRRYSGNGAVLNYGGAAIYVMPRHDETDVRLTCLGSVQRAVWHSIEPDTLASPVMTTNGIFLLADREAAVRRYCIEWGRPEGNVRRA